MTFSHYFATITCFDIDYRPVLSSLALFFCNFRYSCKPFLTNQLLKKDPSTWNWLAGSVGDTIHAARTSEY